MHRVFTKLIAHSKERLTALSIGWNHFGQQQTKALVKVKCQYLTNPVSLTETLGGKHVCSNSVAFTQSGKWRVILPRNRLPAARRTCTIPVEHDLKPRMDLIRWSLTIEVLGPFLLFLNVEEPPQIPVRDNCLQRTGITLIETQTCGRKIKQYFWTIKALVCIGNLNAEPILASTWRFVAGPAQYSNSIVINCCFFPQMWFVHVWFCVDCREFEDFSQSIMNLAPSNLRLKLITA